MSQLLSASAVDVLAAVPDPGEGVAPPGSAGLLVILAWIAWGVFAVIVGGVLVQAGRMGLAHRRGEGMEVTGGLIVALVAAVVAGSAASIVTAVLV